MARNTLKRRPEKFEDIKGIGEKSDPSHYDYPGIDTPTEEPELQPGDLGTDEMFDGVDDALDGMDEAAGGLF